MAKNVLVLVQSYPKGERKDLMYVHTRNLYYKEHGIDLTVLNFSTSDEYKYEGIQVIPRSKFENNPTRYDVFIAHAPNVRNHYMFLRKWGGYCNRLIFFFHGHEVLRLSRDYPKDYSYIKSSATLPMTFQDLYDTFKFSIYHHYYKKIAYKSDFVFVSEWMRKRFFNYLNLTEKDLLGHTHVISNSVGSVFEVNDYQPSSKPQFDFITIRGNLDGSKYCIDLLVELARKNPLLNFLLVGRGQFFNHTEKPDNITWLNKQLSHNEMIKLINNCSCALMLTRTDAQGVMACELATFGIPTIVSDIEICRDVFSCYSNVSFLTNDVEHADLYLAYKSLICKPDLHSDYKHYLKKDTMEKEVELIQR